MEGPAHLKGRPRRPENGEGEESLAALKNALIEESRTELEQAFRSINHEVANAAIVEDVDRALAALKEYGLRGKRAATIRRAVHVFAMLSQKKLPLTVHSAERVQSARRTYHELAESVREIQPSWWSKEARQRHGRSGGSLEAAPPMQGHEGGENGEETPPDDEIVRWEAVPDPVIEEPVPRKPRQPRKKGTLAKRLSDFPPDGQKIVSRATFSEGGPEFTFIRTEGYAFVRVHQTGPDTWGFRIPSAAARVPHGKAEFFDYSLGNTRTLEAALRYLSDHILNNEHKFSEEAIAEAAQQPEVVEKAAPERTLPDVPRHIDHAEVARRVERPAEIAHQIEWLARNLRSSRYPASEVIERARKDAESAEDGDGDAWDELEKTRRRLASEYFWQVEHVSPAQELERTELILDELNRRNVPEYSILEVGALKEELEKAVRATVDDSTGEKRREFYAKISPVLSAYRGDLTQRRNDGEQIPSEEHMRERETIKRELGALLSVLVPNSTREVAMLRDNVSVVRALIALDSTNQRDTETFARGLWLFGELSHRINNAVIDDSEIGQRTLRSEWERLKPKLEDIIRKRENRERNARIENRH